MEPQVTELLEAVAALLEQTGHNGQPAESGRFLSTGQIQVGAILASIIGGFIAFGLRWLVERGTKKSDAAHSMSIELFARFNSKEVLAARAEAESVVIQSPLKHYRDKSIRDIDNTDRKNSIWLVAREYEFLLVAIEEGMVNKKLVAKYSGEIFVYWLQHFRFLFAGDTFETVNRLARLEAFFRERYSTDDWEKMEQRQREHIVSIIGKSEITVDHFANAPELASSKKFTPSEDANSSPTPAASTTP